MIQASTGRPERPCNQRCALHSHFKSSVRETEPAVEQNLKIQMKQEGTKDGIHLLPWADLTMNSQEFS